MLKQISSAKLAILPSMVTSASQIQQGSTTYYKLTIQVTQTPNLQLTKPLDFQFTLSTPDNLSFTLVNSSYPNLSAPNLVDLSLAEIQNDVNVQTIARYILGLKYAEVTASSQVLSIARDFPYYCLVFDSQQGVTITVSVVFNFYCDEVTVNTVTSSGRT